MNLKHGDIFYSVIQKDNNPFEKPRICKFFVNYINEIGYIVSTKQDRYFRNYVFNPTHIYLNYAEAVPERDEKIKIIEDFEMKRREWENEQKKIAREKELARQLEYDNQIKRETKCIIKRDLISLLKKEEKNLDLHSLNIFKEILKQVLGE